MKFSVAPQSMRAWIVADRPMRETERWIRFRVCLVSEALSRAVLKPPTSARLESGSFPARDVGDRVVVRVHDRVDSCVDTRMG